MQAHVDEVSLTDSGMLYLSVSFWATAAAMTAGRPAALTNDFVIQLPPKQVQQVVINSSGQVQGADGQWYDPTDPAPPGGWATTTVTIDRRAYVRGIVVDFVKRAVAAKWVGDRRDKRIRRSALSVADSDVAVLAGATVDT